MKLGEKILELRKKASMSQEELAEKLGVARQTISKWELGETSPDINQAKEISTLFKVSLDELLENDIKETLVEKVSNTEKLAGIIIKILRILGISLIVMLVVDIIAFIIFIGFRKQPTRTPNETITLNCSIEEKEYKITISDDKYFDCPNCNKEMNVYLKDITDWANLEQSEKNINTYFKENGGICK